jgi:hypothetical protein
MYGRRSSAHYHCRGASPSQSPKSSAGHFVKVKLYENIGTLPDGSIFNPNGYDDALVREALVTPALKRKPRVAGPRERHVPWSKADIAKLRSLAKTHTVSDAAKVMGRKPSSISAAAHNFLIAFVKLTWTPEMIERLRGMASTHTVSEAALALDMSFWAVQSACKKHKVSFKKGGQA